MPGCVSVSTEGIEGIPLTERMIVARSEPPRRTISAAIAAHVSS
jgi:hypothetical protein